MCNNQLVVIYIYLFILETLPGVSDLLNNPSWPAHLFAHCALYQNHDGFLRPVQIVLYYTSSNYTSSNNAQFYNFS